MKKIILASTSPRRKELLTQIIPDYEICVSKCDEVSDKKIPSEMVMDIAAKKALPVLAIKDDNCVVIGADTVVVHKGKVLGKPIDKAEAADMLLRLSNDTHTVYTGVCLATKERVDMFFVSSKVIFHELTEDMIKSYVATGSPMDKAGAYGIQDSGFVKEIIGSYTNVMGLPVEEITEHLKKLTEEK
ncbi:MAG: Maf family protein [Clostridia bacterium]|nr:Maf family protein [Clostridia bacterium]